MYIHDKNDLKSYVIKYIICLLPLYIYGFYKNGILLFLNDSASVFAMFKVFYLPFLSVLAYITTNKILKKEFKIDLLFLSLFLVPIFMPSNINLFVYFVINFLFLLFRRIFNTALVITVLSLFSTFQGSIDNPSMYAFSTWDLLWGRNIGGIASTSIILGLIIFIVLSIINDHKYLVSISGLLSFILLSIIFKEYFLLTSGNAILTLLFIASIPDKSPILKKNMLIYGTLVGIIGFILCSFVSPYYGMVLSVLLMNIIYELFILKKCT